MEANSTSNVLFTGSRDSAVCNDPHAEMDWEEDKDSSLAKTSDARGVGQALSIVAFVGEAKDPKPDRREKRDEALAVREGATPQGPRQPVVPGMGVVSNSIRMLASTFAPSALHVVHAGSCRFRFPGTAWSMHIILPRSLRRQWLDVVLQGLCVVYAKSVSRLFWQSSMSSGGATDQGECMPTVGIDASSQPGAPTQVALGDFLACRDICETCSGSTGFAPKNFAHQTLRRNAELRTRDTRCNREPSSRYPCIVFRFKISRSTPGNSLLAVRTGGKWPRFSL